MVFYMRANRRYNGVGQNMSKSFLGTFPILLWGLLKPLFQWTFTEVLQKEIKHVLLMESQPQYYVFFLKTHYFFQDETNPSMNLAIIILTPFTLCN